nr:MAG TPA: hypothetical protein [Caudoviricetes sp.]
MNSTLSISAILISNVYIIMNSPVFNRTFHIRFMLLKCC